MTTASAPRHSSSAITSLTPQPPWRARGTGDFTSTLGRPAFRGRRCVVHRHHRIDAGSSRRARAYDAGGDKSEGAGSHMPIEEPPRKAPTDGKRFRVLRIGKRLRRARVDAEGEVREMRCRENCYDAKRDR